MLNVLVVSLNVHSGPVRKAVVSPLTDQGLRGVKCLATATRQSQGQSPDSCYPSEEVRGPGWVGPGRLAGDGEPTKSWWMRERVNRIRVNCI